MRKRLNCAIDDILRMKGWIEQGWTYDEAMEAHTNWYHSHAFLKPITELLGRKCKNSRSSRCCTRTM